jgi:hypothetical protein
MTENLKCANLNPISTNFRKFTNCLIIKARCSVRFIGVSITIISGITVFSAHCWPSTWGAETHREYFKGKTTIFCTKLKAGNHSFELELMPRYAGKYTLNPAKAEMMYFPVFYGRESMKTIGIK